MGIRTLGGRMTLVAPVTVIALVAFGLSACGSEEDTPSTTASETQDGSPTADSSGDAQAALMLADSAVGEIVVDGEGRAVYQYDADRQGATTSACTGDCAQQWPAVPAGTAGPADLPAPGVTGRLGTITGVDNVSQLTLDGWPLYYYAGDEEPGDVSGQGVGGVWWLLASDGTPVTSTPEGTSTPESEDDEGGKGGMYGY
ncbi:COG4315 family predicted lipoprotein [Nocardioides insulae]|uniref:COG4315 family predicted lipoprotein n=1 Tax=Nocardioides insulae TaxID=394734 RepID=UPI000410987C|nr:hypothetical protein [Nocardioides insulae]